MTLAMAMSIAALAGCARPELKPAESPTKIIRETPGIGRTADPGDAVTIAYTLLLEDGTELLRDDKFSFRLGGDAVIDGIDESVTGMREGGTRVTRIPPHKHWGRAGYADGKVPPHENLTLHVRLIDVSS